MIVDSGVDATQLPLASYAIRWSCAEHFVIVPFADTNIMLWRPAVVGGFFWLYRGTAFVAGGQIGVSLSECWELRFAGQPVLKAVSCPTDKGFTGYAIYRDTVAQKESRCDFVAER